MLLLEGNFVITACNEWEGKVEIIPSEYLKECRLENEQIVVFFLSEKNYRDYNVEVLRIGRMEKQGENNLIKDLQGRGFKIADFIEDKIVNSPYLTEGQLSNICRQRDEKGNVIASN